MSVQNVWESKKYYELARKASLNTEYWGMKELVRVAKNAETILDLGCGEGTRLAYIAKGKKGVGIDISKTAVSLAGKKYPKLQFKNADLSKLPFSNNSFDLVYSAAVLEHLSQPEKMVLEAVRVTKKNGCLLLIAPNYGAPNRCSPVFQGSRMRKFVGGFLRDVFRMMFYQISSQSSNISLNWLKVQPIEDPEKYEMDLDTTVEPYIGTLMQFLKLHGMKIEKYSTCWEEELQSAKVHQKLFRVLSNLGIFPFTQWGPHLVVVSSKN